MTTPSGRIQTGQKKRLFYFILFRGIIVPTLGLALGLAIIENLGWVYLTSGDPAIGILGVTCFIGIQVTCADKGIAKCMAGIEKKSGCVLMAYFSPNVEF